MARILPFFLLLLSFNLPAQEDFRIVGYFPYYRFSLSDQINFEQLTHLNIAFANPLMNGELEVGGQDIGPVVSLAKSYGLTVLISMGGGLTAEHFQAIWTLLRNGTRFVAHAVSLETQALVTGLHASHGGDLVRFEMSAKVRY